MWNPIAAVVDTVGKVWTKVEDRKIQKNNAVAKLSQLKVSTATKVTLSDAEAEAIMASGLNGTYKDEYVTILITFPYLMLILGSVSMVFFADERLLQAGLESIRSLEAAGVDIGFMMEAVVLGALGLKIWRK